MAITKSYYHFTRVKFGNWHLHKRHGGGTLSTLTDKFRNKPRGPFLDTPQIMHKFLAIAWKQGFGSYYPIYTPHNIAIDKAAWAAYAGAQQWENPDGTLTQRSGFQWFSAANVAAAIAAGLMPVSGAPTNYAQPWCMIAAPSGAPPPPPITALTVSYIDGTADFAITPNLLDDQGPPGTNYSAPMLVWAATRPTELPQSTKYGTFFSAARTPFRVDIDGLGTFITPAMRCYITAWPFDNQLPNQVLLAVRYISLQGSWEDSGSPIIPFDVPGPIRTFAIPLQKNWRF